MRLWSIHPKYLDSAGLTACWREALLARKVLQNNTKGYLTHPQLARFKQLSNPLVGIEWYLQTIFEESKARRFHFDGSKVEQTEVSPLIPVTFGQFQYEFEHLKKKLSVRNIKSFESLQQVKNIDPNPLFIITEGGVEKWEILR